MIIFLAVLPTAPPVDTRLTLGGHLFNLCCGVCLCVCCCCCVCIWCCRVCCLDMEKKGVYSDQEEAKKGGNITAINIKKDRTENYITNIRLR